MTISPARIAAAFLRGSTAGTSLSPIGDSPSIAPAIAIVFAVNWPPHAPAPGHATSSSARSSLSVIAPRRARAHRLEHVLDGDVLAAEVAGHDRAAVQHQAGHVQARQRHHRPGDGLVAARQRDDAVAHRAAHRELDRIRDHLARHQRRAHPLGPHADAVGDDDGVELDGRAAGGADAFLDLGAQLTQMQVARRRVGPGVRDRDQRLVQVRVVEPGRLQHRPRGRARDALLDCVAFHSRRLYHAT